MNAFKLEVTLLPEGELYVLMQTTGDDGENLKAAIKSENISEATPDEIRGKVFNLFHNIGNIFMERHFPASALKYSVSPEGIAEVITS